jgi:hypothetical protein
MCQCLSSPKASIRGVHRASCSEYRTVAIQHHKRGFLIGEPAQSIKRNQPVRSDYHQTPKTVSDAREPGMTAGRADTILQEQVSAINPGLYSVRAHSASTY